MTLKLIEGLKPIEVLRKELDKRGIERLDNAYGKLPSVRYTGMYGMRYIATEVLRDKKRLSINGVLLTAEQIIDATLGTQCEFKEMSDGTQTCSRCGAKSSGYIEDVDLPGYVLRFVCCPNCGAKITARNSV